MSLMTHPQTARSPHSSPLWQWCIQLFERSAFGIIITAFVIGFSVTASAQATVYNSVPGTLAPSYPSQPFQAQQTSEFGDFVHLAGTNRVLNSVTMTMVTWAPQSDAANLAYCAAHPTRCSGSGWDHDFTLNIYNIGGGTVGTRAAGSLIATVTQTKTVPWRPAADPGCVGADAGKWKAVDNVCYNGFAYNVTFDMSSLNTLLPSDVVVGLVFNTQTYGPAPMGEAGPFNSLNVGTQPGPASTGTDDNLVSVFWNTSTASWYADGGAAGVGTFREDSSVPNWSGYGTIPIKINATATIRLVDDDGMASATDCDATGVAFSTISSAVAAAGTGDIIKVCPGSYASFGNVTKSLTFMGAQAGVDARTRGAVPESVITGGGLSVFNLNASDVTVDGFKFSNMTNRTIDSTTSNPDNFAMRNCILAGNSGTYSGGSIQFGGGGTLHANGLTFEQNLVLVDNGYLLYMGHIIDNGMVRNNLFHGDSVAFGPFGGRSGWVIEGNEFDGNVSGHGPYWGFGFNSHFTNAVIRNNNVHQMNVGLGQFSVVGGSITGNTFSDNKAAAFQLWGGEFGSPVSSNVQIANNKITYNGAACTGFADASHGIRLRPGGDASMIHMHSNSFVDLGVGACGQAWALRQNDTGTADAELNWWNTVGPEATIQAKIGQGAADVAPWISAYVDDPAHVGQLGFWPLVVTTTAIVSDAPDPNVTGQPFTVTGTVTLTGLGGISGNLLQLPGQVAVSDGTDGCTDTTLSDAGPLGQYSFSCVMTSTTSGNKTLTATYSDTSAMPFYNTSSGMNAHTVFPCPDVWTADAMSHTTYPSLTGVAIDIPVNTTDLTARGVISADFTFNYNTSVLSSNPADISVSIGSVDPTMQININKSTPGSIAVSLYDSSAWAGAGTVAVIHMKVIGAQLTSSPLTLTGFRYNNELVCANVTSGTLSVISGAVSGKVTYKNTTIRGADYRVPNVNLASTAGSPMVTATPTDVNGLYSMSGFGSGAYTVAPSKTTMDFHTPNGIASDDASQVSQFVVGLITLSSAQQEAAKVSGLATISSFDAALISQWIVGIPNPNNQTGRWKFTPVNRTYADVNADHPNENYQALLMGDVTGDWLTGPMARPVHETPTANAVKASLPVITGAPGSELTVPFSIENLQNRPVTSFQFDVEYDPAIISPAQVAADVAGTMSDGMGVASHAAEDGLLKVVVYGTLPVTGDGVYLNLRFKVTGEAGSTSQLTITGFRFNSDTDEVTSVSGQVVVDAAGHAIRGHVLNAGGQPLAGIRITMSDTDGKLRATTSSSTGAYEFGDVTVGQTYTLRAVSRQYHFPAVTVSVVDNLADVDIIDQSAVLTDN